MTNIIINITYNQLINGIEYGCVVNQTKPNDVELCAVNHIMEVIDKKEFWLVNEKEIKYDNNK